MSLWSWLASGGPWGAPSPPPPIPIEPLPPAVEAPGEKQASDGVLGFPQPLLFAALGGYPSNTGVPVTPLTGLQAAAVYGCVKCISEDIAGLTVQIRRRLPDGGWVIDRAHPLNWLLARPDPLHSRFQFWAYVLTCYCLRGNAYIVVERDPAARPVALHVIHPDRVTVQVGTSGYPWYRINSRTLGYGLLIPAEDIIHMRNISLDGLTGLSPIACGQDVIGLALAAQQHGAVLFRQGGQVSGIIKHPGRLGKEASDNIAQSWRDVHSGVQNAHKVAILEEGMTFDKIAITNEDAQFLQTRQFQVGDICRLYRVPPNKVGDYGRATFGNVEQQQLQYKDDCLEPHTDQLADLMSEHLLFDDERQDWQVHWDYTSMLQGDQLQRYQTYQIGLLNGFLSRNEVRARENLNPIAGGDDYRVPLNTADPLHPETIGQTIPRGSAPSEADDGNGQPADL
jgi:HK97 family phage portal protein